MRWLPLFYFISVTASEALDPSESASSTSALFNATLSTGNNVNSFGHPLRPSVALRNIDIDWRTSYPQDLFNPTHLYFNLYCHLTLHWRLPRITTFTRLQQIRTRIYPSLQTWIEPISGSTKLNTDVSAAILWAMLMHTAQPLVPEILEARLSTKSRPSVPIGRIRTVVAPGLAESRNTTLAADSGIKANETMSASSGRVTARLYPKGQQRQYLRITPDKWLHSWAEFSTSIFERRTAPAPVRSGAERVVCAYEQGPDYQLWSQADSMPTPAGADSLTWEELITGLTAVLQEVIHQQLFEPLSADIYKNAWLAANYSYYIVPMPPKAEGDVQTL